ncbi:TVP38/TMEM64 family protein [Amycolatopsis acidiphila]|uniref:TVP38/TMEM64 family protein n=1 Tax=Amycolatopsis acidiphila TaxID=715473 RepID=UPI001643F71F|nr:TVP38/TMEM64 family protein [Amycolatopsis acidiphila]UIJ58064.1 TVP38/TMEM64 family protein [Amycolatopsis acidiphila]GHG70317.1 TVP38/TMEM64 family protein [Amycolatopsis acidiphila]
MPRRTKLIIALAVLAVLVAAAFVVPVPTPAQLRDWAAGAGPATAFLFLAAYSLLTVAPVPRTVFNLAAGLLLGTVAGVAVSITATAISGMLGFGLARLLGRDLVSRHLQRKAVRTVDERLADGGVLAVASLRLIPVVPFAPFGYCCGILSVRPLPYLAGTVLGSLPGTIAVVVLGDALTAGTPPALLACYLGFALVGALGMIKVVRGAAYGSRTKQPATLDPVRGEGVRARSDQEMQVVSEE